MVSGRAAGIAAACGRCCTTAAVAFKVAGVGNGCTVLRPCSTSLHALVAACQSKPSTFDASMQSLRTSPMISTRALCRAEKKSGTLISVWPFGDGLHAHRFSLVRSKKRVNAVDISVP